MARFDGRVALVTGGASGIGKATAKRIAAEGGSVVVADLQDEAGNAVAQEIEQSGGKAAYVHLNVTDEEGWTSAVATTLDVFGRLDILVNNAGIGDTEPLEVTTVGHRRQLLNLLGYALMVNSLALARHALT